MESVYLLLMTDTDGDERIEGVYRTREAAQQRAEMVLEWDVSVDNYNIIEDFVRETADD